MASDEEFSSVSSLAWSDMEDELRDYETGTGTHSTLTHPLEEEQGGVSERAHPPDRPPHPTHPPEEGELGQQEQARPSKRAGSEKEARRKQQHPKRAVSEYGATAPRRTFASLDGRERQPLGGEGHATWTLPDGTPYKGPADDDRLRQGREARHWLTETNAKTGVALGLLTTGEHRKRPGQWQPSGADEDPSYMWPHVWYAQLRRQRPNDHAARTKKRRESRESRDETYCGGRQFMCDLDRETVVRYAQDWRAQNPTTTLQLRILIPMVVDVLKLRDKTKRSSLANALVEAAEREDTTVLMTGTTSEGKVLLGHRILGSIRRQCPKLRLVRGAQR
eukprot:COSAG02_NODE_846_length_16565_cov_20.404627_12_plen_335_part_00